MDNNLQPDLLKALQSNFIQLKGATECAYLSEGEENWIYKVTANGKQYVLRISKAQRENVDFKFEYEYSNYLGGHSIPVAKQYLTVNGEIYCKVKFGDQGCTVCLFDFIKGEIVRSPNKTQIARVAGLIGRIHSVSVNFKPDYDRLESFDPLYWLNDLKKSNDQSSTMNEIYDIYLELSSSLMKSFNSLKKVPLHNDIYFNNILFLGDEIQALIDFDECHKHFIECELGWSMNKVCNFGDYNNYIDNIEIFFENYSKYFSLTKEQLRIVYQNLVCEGMRSYYRYLTKASEKGNDLYYSNILELYKSNLYKSLTI